MPSFAHLAARAVILVLTIRSAPARVGRRAVRPGDAERGDIPGWVMIAIMSAAVVVVLIPFVGPVVADAFNNAIDSVTNTKSGSSGQ